MLLYHIREIIFCRSINHLIILAVLVSYLVRQILTKAVWCI